MKRFFTILLSLLLSFSLVFAVAACNPSSDGGKNPDDPTDGPGGDPAENTVANNQLIESAFGALLDAGALHLSLEDVSFSMEESIPLEISSAQVILTADCYVRKTESGYDFVGKLDLMASADMTDAQTQTQYTDNDFLSVAVYYVDSQLCTVSYHFEQDVVGDVAYESLTDFIAAPESADEFIYTGIIEDFSTVDETIGNDVAANGSRVQSDINFRPANSLEQLIARLSEQVPVLGQFGLNTLDDFVSLIKDAGGVIASLDGGKTEIAEDGSKSVSAKLDLVPLYTAAASFLQDNAENSLGTALDSLAGKGEKYVEKVIDRLFPATGSGLTLNQFIAALEETFAELGAEISFKEIADGVQAVSGMTTQQLADLLNPLIADAAGIPVTITPKEGETLYDTLSRQLFDMIGVDTVLALIPTGSGEGTATEEPSESTGEKMTSAMVNSVLKAYLYNPDLTISALFQSLGAPVLDILGMLDVQKGEISFGFSFDGENKLTQADIEAGLAVYVVAEGGAEKTAMIVCNASAKIAVEYSAADEMFALPADAPTTVYDYEGVFSVGTGVLVRDLLVQAGCITQEEAAELPYVQYDQVDFYAVGTDGYVAKEQSVINLFWVSDQNAYEVRFTAAVEDCEYFLVTVDLDTGYYLVKIQPPVLQAA